MRSKFDIRYSIFNLVIRPVTVFMLLCSKPFLGIQIITTYQVFNIKTNFECTILNIKLPIRDVRNSILYIRTAAVYHLIRVTHLLWHSESYRTSTFLISKLTFNARFLIFIIQYSIFELPLFFNLFGSHTFFGIQKVTEYQVFNIKTNF